MADEDRMLVTLTTAELAALVKRAAADGAREVANELRDPLLKTSELAERLRCEPATIKAAVARGELVPEKRSKGGGRGKSHLIRLSEGLRWIRAKGAA